MPNYCDYSIKVVGAREDCFKFFDKLKSYDEQDHFWRIFEHDICEATEFGDSAALIIRGVLRMVS